VLFASVCALSAACAAPVATSTSGTTSRTPRGASSAGLRAGGESAEGTSDDGQLDRGGSTQRPPTAAARPVPRGGTVRYVAIGDSYTIGEGVTTRERWPNQLVHMLGPAWGLELVANLAFTGATTAAVIYEQLDVLASERPGFVTLLIGVNDVVQGVPPATYRSNAERILEALLARLPPNRIITVATPDYTVTPRGASFGDPRQQSAAIAANNVTLKALAEASGIVFVEIFDISLRAASDRALVADDGLHPSGAQYALWVDRIELAVRALLTAD
jgi:lysophospholipase L1-like esterase